MKYQQVIEDFNNGTLDKNEVQLIMDNDGGYWQGLTDNDDLNDKLAEDAEKKYGSPEGYKDIVDVLNAAGVNCDWC
jgi:hypothetical protein